MHSGPQPGELAINPAPAAVEPEAATTADPALDGVTSTAPGDALPEHKNVEPARAPAAPSHAELRLRERVQSALLARAGLSYGAKHASVEVSGADVTLRGDVRTAVERLDAQAAAQEVSGVRVVTNELSVVNQTPTGSDLRVAR